MHKSLVLSDGLCIFHLDVHTAEHLADFSRLIGVIMYKARVVEFFYRIAHAHEVGAVARFVAQRPAYDTRMIFKSVDHVAGARYASRRPLRISRGYPSGKAVSFEVGLAHYQYAQLVAKPVKRFAVGIVTGTYRRNVVRLAKKQVGLYKFFGHRVTVLGMEFVPVYAAYLDRLAVQKDKRSSAVFHRRDLHFSETEAASAAIHRLSFRFESHLNVVKLGLFVRPKRGVFDRFRKSKPILFPVRDVGFLFKLSHRLAVFRKGYRYFAVFKLLADA